MKLTDEAFVMFLEMFRQGGYVQFTINGERVAHEEAVDMFSERDPKLGILLDSYLDGARKLRDYIEQRYVVPKDQAQPPLTSKPGEFN